MKTVKDPRHLQRISVMQEIFAWEFNAENTPKGTNALLIYQNIGKIDEIISKAAPLWPIDKINKIDLAILRQAVYELTFETKTPQKVVIDEAIELAKQYGSESSAAFINGSLGKIMQNIVG